MELSGNLASRSDRPSNKPVTFPDTLPDPLGISRLRDYGISFNERA